MFTNSSNNICRNTYLKQTSLTAFLYLTGSLPNATLIQVSFWTTGRRLEHNSRRLEHDSRSSYHTPKVSRRKEKLAPPISHTAISTSSDTEAKPSDRIGEVSGEAKALRKLHQQEDWAQILPELSQLINIVWLIYTKFCIS